MKLRRSRYLKFSAITCGLLVGIIVYTKLVSRTIIWPIHNYNQQMTRIYQDQTVDEEVIKSKRPHVIFILSDDLGWNDIGYHNPEIRTPNIDKLAKEGVRLENYYAQATCTPTRASIMTGRYQSQTGIERIIQPYEATCLPSHFTTLPQILQRNGYRTHLIGKWHLGMSRPECLPKRRGFDTFLGYHGGAEDYYTRIQRAKYLSDPTLFMQGFDFWENENMTHKYDDIYSTHLFTKEAQKIVVNHSKSGVPMFLFLSLQAVHSPLQVPLSYKQPYEGIFQDRDRKLYAAMVSAMDEGIGNITKTLQLYEMLNSTVLIFSSDNGGDLRCGASNAPLAGGKAQFLEGGIRVVGFVHSNLLSPSVKGKEYPGLMGAADWMKTIVEGIAGGSMKGTNGDGINMWPSIRDGLSFPRKEYVHAVGGNCDWDPKGSDKQRLMYGTIRMNDWKLRIGLRAQKSFYGVNQTIIGSNTIALHNIKTDPTESQNLQKKKSNMTLRLINRLKVHCKKHTQYALLVESKQSDPKLHNGNYVPWLEDEQRLEFQFKKDDLQTFKNYFIFW